MIVFFKIKQLIPLISISVMALFIIGCAQIVNPTGGAKDTNPPKIEMLMPANASTNFTGNKITIQFNEYVQTTDVATQLITSPPLKNTPDLKVKGKEVIVTIEDTLLPNTTYHLSFGSSITDITENNSLDNFQYVFSTGPIIDSLKLSGKVTNAFTAQPEKGILVMLYSSNEDSLPYKKTPRYFTKTKEDGSYTINYIKEGKYKIIALKDANSNYLYDTPEERIAYSDSLVALPTSNKIDLKLFAETPQKQYVKKAIVPENQHLLIVMNKPSEKLAIVQIDAQKDSIIKKINANNDSIQLWIVNPKSDSIRLKISDENFADTVELKTIISSKKEALKIIYPTSELVISDIGNSFKLKFNQPIASVYKTEDSTNTTIELVGDEVHLKSATKFKENSDYRLLFLPKSITGVTGEQNADSLKFTFRTKEEKSYGTLKLNIVSKEKIILQLLNEQGNVVHEKINFDSGIIDYAYLAPGKYSLRAIHDTNHNNKWDTGNYSKHLQPEKIIYAPSTITIRSNWDVEQKWELE